jgi:4-hydroxy-tetrahydrodipicolinate synthase
MPDHDLQMFCMSATPFHEDRSLDEDGLRAHLQRLVDANNAIYLASPGAGEAQVLTIAEHRRIYDIGVEVAKGKVPVYANPRESVSAELYYEVAKEAIEAGVDAVQIYALASPGNWAPASAPVKKSFPDLRELEAYYHELLDEIDHPVVLSTSAAVPTPPTPAMVARLCARYDQIIAVNAMVPTGDMFVAFRDATPAHLPVYGSFFGFGHWLLLGASGAVIAENNVLPNVARRVVDTWAAGDIAGMREASLLLHRFSLVTREWFPATARPVKMAMKVLGLGNGVLRPPYLLPPEEDFERLGASLDALRVREIEGLPTPDAVAA